MYLLHTALSKLLLWEGAYSALISPAQVLEVSATQENRSTSKYEGYARSPDRDGGISLRTRSGVRVSGSERASAK